jgi:hypothetical protein
MNASGASCFSTLCVSYSRWNLYSANSLRTALEETTALWQFILLMLSLTSWTTIRILRGRWAGLLYGALLTTIVLVENAVLYR